LWKDDTESRWPTVYGLLKPNDNAIFIADNKLLIGTIAEIKKNKSILCNNIDEIECSNDHFLQLNEIYPELVSRIKANFQPFIHSKQININKLIADAKASNFISYYILSNFSKYNELKSKFNTNDRIIILDSDKKFGTVKIHSSDGLVDFPPDIKININVIGLTLNNVLDKNEEMKHKDKKSNNVSRIKNIISEISSKGIFKFKSFFAYHDTLYNKRVYGDTSSTSLSIKPTIATDPNFKLDEVRPPLNQILYGPPGTGKTYSTINKALQILGIDIEGKSRQEIKELFDIKMSEGRIVFTTFHQSMSYEDFIEGIKPDLNGNDTDNTNVNYKIVNGIFCKVCIDASFAIAQLTSKNKSVDEVLDFSLQYDKFVESIEEKLVTAQQVKLDTKSGGAVLVDSISQLGNIIIKHLDGTRTYTVSKARLTKLQSVITDLNDVNNINNQFRAVIGGSNSSAYWSVLNEIRKVKLTASSHGEKREYTEDEKTSAISKLTKADYSDYTRKMIHPYVLIIDEINRGNVSQIFGELITLIEDDKRMGNRESLEATLPYSKKTFGVPPNLYIIGTMNTADRSVEALDTALRRRFCFEEMLPQPEIILDEGKINDMYQIDLVKLLKTINKRIEKLLDKDHQIGHSFFMSAMTIDRLKHVFQYKIIPMLQEYFYGDYGKIGLVLGKGFFEPIESASENIFANFDEYDASDFAERTIYKFINVKDMSDEIFINAINLIYNK